MRSSGAACLLALVLVATGRAADASKQVHDAVRDFIDLKRYVWRESRSLGRKLEPFASGRTEVDAYTLGVFNGRRQTELAFVNLGARTAFKLEANWKTVAAMDADEMRAIFNRAAPKTRAGSTEAHWNFVPPHDVLVAIVGMAPAPDWIGDKIVGIMALDEVVNLYLTLTAQGELEWEWTPPAVRNRLGGISPPPPGPSAAQKQAALRRIEARYVAHTAEYELYLRDGIISKLVLRLDVGLAGSDGARPPSRSPETWVFEFSEVGRIDVTPDPAAKDVLTAN
jgi:hypothetical protein